MCYECERKDAILKIVMKRLKFLEGYTGDCDTHHGVRLAAMLLRSDIRSVQQRIPRDPSRRVRGRVPCPA